MTGVLVYFLMFSISGIILGLLVFHFIDLAFGGVINFIRKII